MLKSYYVDTYYGRKLKMEPTSGIDLEPVVEARREEPEGAARRRQGRRCSITSFIGGNSNSGTGDFSVGVVGFRVRERRDRRAASRR